MDTYDLTFLLRLFFVFLCLLIAREAYLIQNLIESKRLTKLFYMVTIFFVSFALGRLIASLIDNYLEFSIGYISNLVNISAYLLLFAVLKRQRHTIQRLEHDTSGQKKITELIESLVNEMVQARKEIRQKRASEK